MNNYFKYISAVLVFILSLSFSSCDNNDDNKTDNKDLYEIIVNKPVVRINTNEQVTVNIVLGNGNYSVKSYDSSIATATINGETITIKSAAKNGSTTVQVIDGEGVTGNITVAVGTFELEVNYPTVKIEKLEEQLIIVSSGNFSSNDELSYEISDPSIVSLTNTDPYRPYFLLKGKNIGTATITFTDRMGKTTNIDVQIDPISIDVSTKNPVLGVNNKGIIRIEKGSGGYSVTSENDIVTVKMIDDVSFSIIGNKKGTSKVFIKDSENEEYIMEVTVTESNKVASLGSSIYFSIPFKKADGQVDASLSSLNSVTYEARIRLDKKNDNTNGNARINTVMGIEGVCLLRIDVRKNSSDTESRYLQLAADNKGGVRVEGNTPIETDTWYNVAVVVDAAGTEVGGNNGRIRLYINGVEETYGFKSGTYTDLKEINLTSNFYIAQSDGKRRLNGGISYARIWNKALTAAEIEAYNNKPISFSSPGLVAYWSFNDAVVNTKSFTSLTDNDFAAIANDPGVTNWIVDPSLGGE